MSNFRKPGGRPRFNRAPQKDAHRINHFIRAREVRVITDSGEQLGVMQIRKALDAAEEAGLDLVEVSPNSEPPVCKIMDYGKFKYKEQKKLAESKKKRTEIEIKEIRIRYRTGQGDLETKLKKARGFLLDGDKVKFSMRFRGREIMYQDLGLEKFREVAESLKDISSIEEQPKEPAKQIFLILAPAKPGQ